MCLLYDWHHPPIKPLIHFNIATKHYSARISPICRQSYTPMLQPILFEMGS